MAGCLVERFRNDILRDIPEVDAVIGTGEVENILSAVRGDVAGENAHAASASNFLYHDLTPRLQTTPRHAAYIKIAEGCDHPCSFCIIPQLRGKFRSRRFESVVREAENLAAAGVREVTLIGQDTTSYGEDLGLRDGLAQLLARLADVEELAWVRFLYAYPNRLTQRAARYARRASAAREISRHAAATRIAEDARFDEARLQRRCISEIARARAQNCARNFAAHLFHRGISRRNRNRFSRAVRFRARRRIRLDGSIHLFRCGYRCEPRAWPQSCRTTKISRRDRLMAIQRKISARKLAARVGRSEIALLEGPSTETELLWEARLEGMAPEIDGKLYINDIVEAESGAAAQPGDMVRVEITEAHDYDLIGRVTQIVSRSNAAAREENSASVGDNDAQITQQIAPLGAAQRIATGAPLRIIAINIGPMKLKCPICGNAHRFRDRR